MVTDQQLRQLAENRQRRATYTSLSELVDCTARHLNQSDHRRLKKAQELWLEVVEPELSALAFPSALRNGVLVVSVAEPAAKFTIEQIYRTPLLEQLRSVLGRSVRDIKCVLQSPTGA